MGYICPLYPCVVLTRRMAVEALFAQLIWNWPGASTVLILLKLVAMSNPLVSVVLQPILPVSCGRLPGHWLVAKYPVMKCIPPVSWRNQEEEYLSMEELLLLLFLVSMKDYIGRCESTVYDLCIERKKVCLLAPGPRTRMNRTNST